MYQVNPTTAVETGAGLAVPGPALTPEVKKHQQINAVAGHVFNAYHQCMRNRYGMAWPLRPYGSNKYDAAFRQLAELCVGEEWDPDQFVKSALDQLQKNHHYVTPRDLLRDTVVSRYRIELSLGQARYNPLGEWETHVSDLMIYVYDTHSTEAAVLLTPMTPFPAWFRLVYPEKLDEKIFEWWGDLGRKEFAQDGRLRAFVRKVSPKPFAQLEERWGRFGDVEIPQ